MAKAKDDKPQPVALPYCLGLFVFQSDEHGTCDDLQV